MSIAPVIIPIQVAGVKDIGKAIKSVEDLIEGYERRHQQREARQRKGFEDTARSKERIGKKSASEEENRLKKGLKLYEDLEKIKTNTEKKELDKRLAERDRHERRVISRNQNAIRREQEMKERANVRSQERYAMLAGRGTVRGISQAGRLAVGTLAAMGGFGIVDSIQSRTEDSGLAAEIALSGSKMGGKKFHSKEVLSAATSVGIESGLGTHAALEGLQEWTKKTGELEMGTKLLKDIAVFADASGTGLKDMASASAELFASGTVKNGEELKGILGSIIEMGKDGAVEISDLARGFGRITASAGQFEGDKNANVRKLTAFAEMSKKFAAATPREALTSIQNLASDIAKHSKGFSKLGHGGVNVFDRSGKFLRDPMEILKESMFKSNGLSVKQQHDLFGERSFRAVAGASEIFNKARAGGSTNQQAWGKVEEEFSSITGHILSYDQAQKDASERRAEADRKFATALEDLKTKVGDQLLPVLTQMIPTLAEATPSLVALAAAAGHLAEIFTDHPWLGLGAIVAGFIGKEIAAAKLAQVVQAAIGANGGVGGALSAGVGAAGGGAKLALTVGTAIITAASVSGAAEAIDEASDAYSAGAGYASQSANKLSKLTRKINAGKATPTEIAEAKKQMDQVQGTLGAAKGADTGVANRFFSGFLATTEAAGAAVMNPLGIKTDRHNRDESAAVAQAKGMADNSENLERALKELTMAINSGKVAGSGMGDLKRSEGMAQRGGTQ